MLKSLLTRVSLFLLAGSLLFADQITMKNGDRLSGAILKYDGKNLIMKTEFAGQVTIPWDAVTAINSTEPLNVGLKGGQTLVGTVTTAGGTIQVATANAGTVTAPKDSIEFVRSKEEQVAYQAEIDRFHNPRLIDLWTGFLDLGYATTRGNSDTSSFNLNSDVSRSTNRDKIEATFTMIQSSSNASGKDISTADAKRGGVSYNLNLNPRWFAFGAVNLENDEFQSLDLRFNPAGGGGYHALKTPKTTLDFKLGASEDKEFYSTNLDRSFTEVVLGEEFVHKINASTSIHQQLSVFPNLSATGNYRVNFDLAAVTAIRKWFGWQFTVSDRFLTNPIAGKKESDLLISTGLRLTFAK